MLPINLNFQKLFHFDLCHHLSKKSMPLKLSSGPVGNDDLWFHIAMHGSFLCYSFCLSVCLSSSIPLMGFPACSKDLPAHFEGLPAPLEALPVAYEARQAPSQPLPSRFRTLSAPFNTLQTASEALSTPTPLEKAVHPLNYCYV